MAIHHLEDKDLLYLLQVVIKNGNLMNLVNESTNFYDYEIVEDGIAWLLQEGIILKMHDGYQITSFGETWRLSIWRKLGLRGIYRYLYPSNQTEGGWQSLDDPFLPKKFEYKKS